MKDAGQIGIDHFLPVAFRHLCQRRKRNIFAVRPTTGVIKCIIQRTKCLHRCLNRFTDRIIICHITFNKNRLTAVFPYSLHRFQCLWISGRHSHPAAKTAKTNSCGLSHTGSRPCYKSCFSFKFFKYFHLFLLSDNHSRIF